MVRRLALTIVLPLLLAGSASAIQVAPNSPCALACIDSDDLDTSDPNSSNTRNADITCADSSYTSPVGKKWQKCMSCLQTSTFSQGSESDQAWFLYNLRYSFDICVFGFPNATGLGSNPCQTSTACGGLEVALEDGKLSTHNLDEFGYCDADGKAITGPSYAKCLACVGASGETNYITNALVAMEAGCLQRPARGQVVGLNDTIFSTNLVSIVDPSTVGGGAGLGGGGSSGTSLSVPVIVGIIVAAVIVLAGIAAFLYVRHRKQRARLGRTSATLSRGHRPKSSLSFRCQTHLTPKSPSFPFTSEEEGMEETTTASGPPTPRHITSAKSKQWKPHNSVTADSFQSAASVTHAPPLSRNRGGATMTSTMSPSAASLAKLDTTLVSTQPYAAPTPDGLRKSPFFKKARGRSGSAASLTPATPATGGGDSFVTPVSSTSDVLLPRYNPADFAAVGGGSSISQHTSPSSAHSTSPLLRQREWSPLAVAPLPALPALPGHFIEGEASNTMPAPPRRTSRMSAAAAGLTGSSRTHGAAGGSGSPNGSPSESNNLQFTFPGPPRKPQRK